MEGAVGFVSACGIVWRQWLLSSRKKMIEQFKEIVGAQSYSAFLNLLKEIGPDARTHRISVVIAAIMRFALMKVPRDCGEGTLGKALVALDEEPYLVAEESEEYQLVFDLIDGLCREAGIHNLRESSRGTPYSVAESAIAEYTEWYNMPWE
jgi:hypothetical protein